MAELFKQLVESFSDTIPGGATKVVNSLPLVAFEALEYTFVFLDSTGKKKSFKLFVRKDDTDLETQVYGKGGFPFQLSVDAFFNGANAEIRIQNLEPFPINLKATRQLT